jgi:glycosyltransferase involved in cell wall biosynthesis
VKLVFVGSGPMKDELDAAAKHLGVAADVVFQPAVADVVRWLHAMDIFVLPSRSEAMSNALMEAMACGVASVASNVGGNPELVREGETGLLFPSEDAEALTVQLRRLVDDTQLRTGLAEAGAAFIRSERTIETAAVRMAGIYGEMLGL